MIRQNFELQCLECSICGEALELMSKTASRPDLVALAKEEMAEEHRECEQYQGRPEMARAAREFKRRLKAELKRQERKNRGSDKAR